MVDTIFVSLKPASLNKVLYSASVRSQPGNTANICKSNNLLKEGSLPVGTTISMTNNFRLR